MMKMIQMIGVGAGRRGGGDQRAGRWGRGRGEEGVGRDGRERGWQWGRKGAWEGEREGGNGGGGARGREGREGPGGKGCHPIPRISNN